MPRKLSNDGLLRVQPRIHMLTIQDATSGVDPGSCQCFDVVMLDTLLAVRRSGGTCTSCFASALWGTSSGSGRDSSRRLSTACSVTGEVCSSAALSLEIGMRVHSCKRQLWSERPATNMQLCMLQMHMTAMMLNTMVVRRPMQHHCSVLHSETLPCARQVPPVAGGGLGVGRLPLLGRLACSGAAGP